MGEKLRRLVDGFRWVCTEGRDQCEACRALCGREFWHDPAPGQAGVEGMPEPPLHPHCSCRLELLSNAGWRILDAADGIPSADIHDADPYWADGVNFITPGLSEQFNTGRLGWFGLVYCCDGRYREDGPAYGNYGGQNWRFGRNESKIDELADAEGLTRDEWLTENYIPPIDSLDSVFEDHDYCYEKGGNQPKFSAVNVACDQAMINTLENLDEDPRKWSDPPKNEEDVEYASKFRKSAIVFFQAKSDYARLLEKYGKEYMDRKYWDLNIFL